MNQSIAAPMDADKSRIAAHAIKKRLEELNTPIKLNHAYEALAIAHRHPNWATMKALISGPPASSKVPDFDLGTFFDYVDGKRVDEKVSVHFDEALNHIHGFSTSHAARHDLLRELSGNGMRAGGSCIFVEPVSDPATKSGIINRLLRQSSSLGRRSDFFVLDFSTDGSRIGNTCNILDEMDVESAVEFFVCGFRSADMQYFHARTILRHCAQRFGGRTGRITMEGMRQELEALEKDGIPRSLVDEQAPNVRFETSLLPRLLLNHLERISVSHARLLDHDAPWSGFRDIFSKPQILLIFVDPEGTELSAVLNQVTLAGIRKAIGRKGASATAQDMLLLNDVDFLGSGTGMADLSATKRLCLVVADQCPTPPHQFPRRPISFRSDAGKENNQNWIHHELITDEGERRIWPGLA